MALENDGKAAAKEGLREAKFTVKGDRYTLTGGGGSYRGMLKLNPTKKPKTLDATFVDAEGKEKGKAVGIYELEGGRLRIC